MKIKLGKKNTSYMGGWTRYATLDNGRMFQVCVSRGKRVRIAFQRRGKNIGFHWWAMVREVDNNGDRFPKTIKRFVNFRVSKSLGVRGILRELNLLDDQTRTDS